MTSVLRKNCRVIPSTAPQSNPKPQLAVRNGQRISSPLPSAKPNKITEGPKVFQIDGGDLSDVMRRPLRAANQATLGESQSQQSGPLVSVCVANALSLSWLAPPVK